MLLNLTWNEVGLASQVHVISETPIFYRIAIRLYKSEI
jgi:hypothetical protein